MSLSCDIYHLDARRMTLPGGGRIRYNDKDKYFIISEITEIR